MPDLSREILMPSVRYKMQETGQRIFQYLTRTGNVPTQEPLSFRSVHRSAVEPQTCLPKQTFLQLSRRNRQRPAVRPDQIGALQFRHRNLRQMVVKKITEKIIICLQIVQQLQEPFLTLIIGCNSRLYTEWIHIAHFVDIDGTIYPIPGPRQ